MHRRWILLTLVLTFAISAQMLTERAHGAPKPAAAGARPARTVRQTPPEYPSGSRQAGETGQVLVRVRVLNDGTAQTASLSRTSGFPELDAAAVGSVLEWQFAAARDESGTPIDSDLVVSVDFSARDGEAGESDDVPIDRLGKVWMDYVAFATRASRTAKYCQSVGASTSSFNQKSAQFHKGADGRFVALENRLDQLLTETGSASPLLHFRRKRQQIEEDADQTIRAIFQDLQPYEQKKQCETSLQGMSAEMDAAIRNGTYRIGAI